MYTLRLLRIVGTEFFLKGRSMDQLTKLLWQKTKRWPWHCDTQSINALKINISTKKFDLRVKVYVARLEIDSFYIKPQYRRQKLGTTIVTELKKFTLERKLFIQANYPTPWAEEFWTNLQFQKQQSHVFWIP